MFSVEVFFSIFSNYSLCLSKTLSFGKSEKPLCFVRCLSCFLNLLGGGVGSWIQYMGRAWVAPQKNWYGNLAYHVEYSKSQTDFVRVF